jgi:ATP-dependent helicase/nuclease subunit A
LRQMGAYHAMLTEIWPGRTIDVAILWTAKARLMPMPQALVTTALARATLP